jgi:hypothetical protein
MSAWIMWTMYRSLFNRCWPYCLYGSHDLWPALWSLCRRAGSSKVYIMLLCYVTAELYLAQKIRQKHVRPVSLLFGPSLTADVVQRDNFLASTNHFCPSGYNYDRSCHIAIPTTGGKSSGPRPASTYCRVDVNDGLLWE